MPNIIVFNSAPKPFKPFPLEKFDFNVDLETAQLSFKFFSQFSLNTVSLYLVNDGRELPIGKIELYHSAGHVNFEQTFESAKILANEIVKRFNQKEKQGGQLCFVLS